MEQTWFLVVWSCLLSLGLCSTHSRIEWTERWPGGAKGRAYVRPSLPIHGWTMHLHFSLPLTGFNVWSGLIVSHKGQDVDVINMPENARVAANGEVTVEFIVHWDRLDKIISGLYNNSVTPDRQTDQTTSPHVTESTPEPQTTSTPSTTVTMTTETTTTTRPSTSSTIISTTQPNPTQLFHCNKVALIMAVGSHTHATSANAHDCQDGMGGSNEDLVLARCDITKPDAWRRGINVMKNCHQLPLFTPIATFYDTGSDVYAPRGAQSGVFAGCLPNGFRLIVQHCHGNPVIEHIEQGGIFTQDPYDYYTIS